MKLNGAEKTLVNNPVRAALQRHWEASLLLRLGGRVEGLRVLEIGCGRGVGTEIILERFGAAFAVALDFDPRMVRLAEQRLRRYGPRVRVQVGDAAALELDDGEFDAVFDFGIAGPPAPPRPHPQVRTAELEDKNRLARSGEIGIKQLRPGPSPLAGFEVIMNGRFRGDHRGAFGTASLGFSLSLIKDESYPPGCWAKALMALSLLLIFFSIVFGIWCETERPISTGLCSRVDSGTGSGARALQSSGRKNLGAFLGSNHGY